MSSLFLICDMYGILSSKLSFVGSAQAAQRLKLLAATTIGPKDIYSKHVSRLTRGAARQIPVTPN